MAATTCFTHPAADEMAAKCRDARFNRFLGLVTHLHHPVTILDVGGTVGFWSGRIKPWMRVTLVNRMPQAGTSQIESAVGDACDLSEYVTQSFDVAFSNSVIGHVGGWANQQRMAREMQRVGRHVYLQTPNHWFPIDWRTLVPCFHWLPASVQALAFRALPVGTYRRAPDARTARNWATRIRNLRHDELCSLFPGAAIERERVGGFTKSFVVHSFVTGSAPS